MKLIKNLIITKVDNKYLLINSLNGLVDRIDSTTLAIITKWHECNEIIPIGNLEKDLFNKLKSRGYLCNSHREEIKIKEKIISALREKHFKAKENNTNITFIMTYDCNLRCPYCFEDFTIGGNNDLELLNFDSKKAVLNTTLIDAAFDLVGDSLETIGLFGGEPLLPKTMSALEYIISREPDKIYYITTNGYYLDTYIQLLSKIKISYIMVTLDGDEKMHDSRRYLANGGATFKKILMNIEKCLKKNIPIRIRMNLENSNYSECIALRTKLLNQFNEYENLLSFEMSPMIEMKSTDRNYMFRDLYKEDIEQISKGSVERNKILSRFSPIINALTTGKKLSPNYSFCYAHRDGIIVDPHGYIYPCLLSVGKKSLAIGKYYPRVEYFENSIYNRSIENIPECKDCRYSLLCGGGCPLSLNDYSNFYKPECFSIKNQIHNMLPMFFNQKRQFDKNKNESASKGN